MGFDLRANLAFLNPVGPTLREWPTRMQRVPRRLHLTAPAFSSAGFPARRMNAEAVNDAIPKRPVMPDEKPLGEWDPNVINNEVPASEISDV